MSVASILKEKGADVVTIAADATLYEVACTLARHRIGALMVKDSTGGVGGVISERDIIGAISASGASALESAVSAAMVSAVTACSPGDGIDKVMKTMTQGRFRHMPVVENGRMIGIISIGDVVKRRIADATHEAEALKKYIATG